MDTTKIRIGSQLCLTVDESISARGDAWFTVSEINEDGLFECYLPNDNSHETEWATVPANGDGILDSIL